MYTISALACTCTTELSEKWSKAPVKTNYVPGLEESIEMNLKKATYCFRVRNLPHSIFLTKTLRFASFYE